MSSFAVLPAPGAPFDAADWSSLGLVACIVGAFLIANSTLFEHPRSLVARYFGRGGSGRLQSVRDYIYNRVQTTLGFAFLLAGFGFQLVGHFRAAPTGAAPLSMAWVGVIVAIAVALLFGGWWWSLWAFRRYVREHFTRQPRNLLREPSVAREIGELWGIESRDDDTVEDYVARLVRETGLPAGAPLRPGIPDDFEFDSIDEGADEGAEKGLKRA